MKKRLEIFLCTTLLMLIISACENNPGSELDQREKVAKEFLNKYYEVTSEDVNGYAEFFLSFCDEKITAEETQVELDDYSNSLANDFREYAAPKEINRLIANRQLDKFKQLALEGDCTYAVKNISLMVYEEKESFIIYDYKVTLKCEKNDSKKVKNYSLEGKMLVELERQNYVVSHVDLDMEP